MAGGFGTATGTGIQERKVSTTEGDCEGQDDGTSRRRWSMNEARVE